MECEEGKTMRESGILMPVSSLPGPYGIGCFGKEAFKFVDFLADAGQKIWQLLPLSPTGYGDSPYQSCSAFAGNPYFIDLDALKEEGLLTAAQLKAEPWGDDPKQVDYGTLYTSRYKVLRTAYAAWRKACKGLHGCSDYFPDDYYAFTLANEDWLDDYALYMAVKGKYEGKGWMDWDEDIRFRRPEALSACREELAEEINYWKFLQFKFFEQWKKLKQYAKEKELQIVGDIPIYVALDSADVWSHPELFQLDEENLTPLKVSGVPPDAFSENGQKWGSPVYNWSRMEEDGFAWWQARMLEHAKLFDVIRLDHFAAIVKYYVVPNKAEDGRSGKWSRGPGKKLTDAIEKVIGDTHIIVEDIAGKSPIPGVKKLMARTGWPGIKILMFAFGDDTANEHLPHNYTDCNLVVYAGTHDNETIVGYFRDKTDYELAYLYEYLNIKYKEEIPDALIRAAYASIADVVIIQMQDLMKLGNEARMNAPSTVGRNWRWRIGTDELSEERRAWIRTLASVYHR